MIRASWNAILMVGIVMVYGMALGDTGSTTKVNPGAVSHSDSVASSETLHSPAIQWETDYNAAMEKAKTTGKPVMIDFYTDWCTWCKVLDKETYPDPAVVKAASGMVSIKINGEEHPELAQKYGVTSYPRILFLTSEGKVLHQIRGFKPADDFLPDMKAVLLGKTPRELAEALMEKGTDDPHEQKWIGMLLLEQNKIEEAVGYFEKALPNLEDKDRVSVQRVLPFVYIARKDVEKAKAAFAQLEANPKADPEMVAENNIRFSYQLKDRARLENAIDQLMGMTKSPAKKASLEQLRGKLDQLLPIQEPPGSSGAPEATENPTGN